MLSEDQIKLLQGYRDKSYITSILCQQSEEHLYCFECIYGYDSKLNRKF